MSSSPTLMEFPLYDPFNVEQCKKVDELVTLINLVKKSPIPTKTIFFRFIRENVSLNKCDKWFLDESYKVNIPKGAQRIIDSLHNFVEAAKNKKYWPLQSAEENFDILRGVALELYVETCIKKRYKSVFCNCIVSIDKKPYCHKTNAKPRTLDVVGWDYTESDGELIECKVFAYRLITKKKDQEKLSFLISLQNCLKESGSNARVGIASFENDFELKKEFKNVENIIFLVGYQKLLYIDERRCG